MRGTRASDRDDSDRGQAYTLEGFAAAAVVLFALLFAMQSLVITPGTGGAVDRTAQAQMQQETQDALVVAAHADAGDGNLSEYVRYWAFVVDNEDEEYDEDAFYDSTLGDVLETHVAEPAYPDDYRVELTYLGEMEDEDDHENATNTEFVAGTNITDDSAVTASYTVPVFEDDEAVAYDDGDFDEIPDDIPAEPLPEEGDEPVHNVVEVRVTVW